jgi:Fe-Mn family superoxide dismutase
MLTITRRSLIGGAGALAAAAIFDRARAQTQTSSGPFQLEPLEYDYYELEPDIDELTMKIHYERHHRSYVDSLNKAVADYPDIAKLPLQDILAKLNEMPEAIRTTLRNAGGGHANHTMFWEIMGPGGGKPAGELLAAIDSMGGFDKFKEEFNNAGLKQFGSGWVFVTVDKSGTLAIESRPNQDTPLMEGKRVLMGNDVWEHAYYLKYQNLRGDYLKAWWNVVDWDWVGKRYAAAKAGTLKI